MTADGPPKLKHPVSADDRTRGPADAPVTIVEYADYQCRDCRNSHPVISRVVESLGDQVRLVFRHFPVVSRHDRAQAAALAAEAAGEQGRFWEMHHRLMEAGAGLSPEDLRTYADEVGLDRERFERDAADPRLAARIHQGKLLGVRSGVNGTPTLFINDVRYEGANTPVEEAELRAALQDALNRAGGL